MSRCLCASVLWLKIWSQRKFIGFYETSKTTANRLFQQLQYVLISFWLPIRKCWGHCYDSTSNQSSIRTGQQACVQEQEPWGLRHTLYDLSLFWTRFLSHIFGSTTGPYCVCTSIMNFGITSQTIYLYSLSWNELHHPHTTSWIVQFMHGFNVIFQRAG